MKILMVMDPIEDVNILEDTSFGFALAAQARGHQLYYCQQSALFVHDGHGGAWARPLEVSMNPDDFFRLGSVEELLLKTFDSIWMRKDPPVDRAYLHATHILDLAGPGTLVVNSPQGVRYANEKLYAQSFPQYCPPTFVSRSPEKILEWSRDRGESVVVKHVDGHGGSGVFVIHSHDRNANSIVETLTENGRRWVVTQSYLPEAREGDKRVIILNGKVQGAIIRIPRDEDNRGNIHVGGRVERIELSDRDREICRAVAPALVRDGLYFVGLDIIGGYLTEINVTSPTGIREIQNLTGLDIGDRFVQWVEESMRS